MKEEKERKKKCLLVVKVELDSRLPDAVPLFLSRLSDCIDFLLPSFPLVALGQRKKLILKRFPWFFFTIVSICFFKELWPPSFFYVLNSTFKYLELCDSLSFDKF